MAAIAAASASAMTAMPRTSDVGPSPSAPSNNAAANASAPPTVAGPLTNGSNGTADTSVSTLFAKLEGKATAEQIDILTQELAVATRIKEGAENMLHVQQMRTNEPLRVHVESELENARGRIEVIALRIEKLSQQESRRKASLGSAPPPAKRKGSSQTLPTPKPKEQERDDVDDRDDFQTVLRHAASCIKTLVSLDKSSTFPTTHHGHGHGQHHHGQGHGASTSAAAHSGSATPGPDAQTDRLRIETMHRLTGILQSHLRVRYELNAAELLQAVVPGLSDRSTKECRAAAYRLIRHVLIDTESVERLREQSLDWYIIKSLARDNKHAVEKEQVIKLIRAIVEIGSERRAPHTAAGSGTVPLSEGVMRAFIAIAEQPEDPFRSITVQTLVEILLIDIALMERTGGIGVLLHNLAEGPPDMAPILASAFLYIVDSPRTRVYLTPGTDLEIALSGVTDAYGKGPDHVDRMKGCIRVIATMFRTWSGLMYFCMDDMAAVRSIINMLRIPSLDTRDIVLDMFFDLLNIKPPEWYKTFIDGRRLTMYRKPGQPHEPKPQASTQRPQESLKLTDQYIALLLLIFTKAGLLDAVVSMLEESTGSALSRKATLLMAEILQMANRLLPLSTAADVQALTRIFDLAADYNLGEGRIVGTLALSAIDSFNRNHSRLQPTVIAKTSRPRANSVEDAMRRGQRQFEQVKIKMGMQMDDRTFQATLLETNVMMTKDHTKWNFDILQDLIEGPLLQPKRMDEAVKGSKFMRRLMSFYHPFSHRFSDLQRGSANARWVKLGNSLLATLLATPDGQRYLSTEDGLLREIVQGFAQLDPFNGTPNSDPLFSKSRVQNTLTYSYLEMLGTLSKQKEGIELMEKFKVFTAFYHLSELRSREDLIKGIIENLDYDIDGHPRIVLSKALTSSYMHIRLFATNHLGELIRNSSNPNMWTLRLLLTQLYDPAGEVCEAAVRFLQEACESPEVLRLVVEMQPTLEHLGDIGHPLLLKFMSTPIGFRYLHDAGYIDREMDLWFHDRNIVYVIQIEVFLARAFNFSLPGQGEDAHSSEGAVPPHFYGEIAKTELGCTVLQEKGHFGDFAHFIRRHGLDIDDPDVVLKLKSILWAVGNIGAADGGLHFLEEEEIIPSILEIAEQSEILSVRGTCFFVLGLISSTAQGAEILADYGWEATLSPLGLPTGMCVPTDLEKFLLIPPWEPTPEKEESRLVPLTKDTETEVMTALHNLSNTVIANTASRALAKMKSRPEFRHVFSSSSMFYRALHTISTEHYRLPVRRYILDLFDFDLNPDSVGVLGECAKKLRTSAPLRSDADAEKPPERVRVVSMFGRVKRPDSSDEEDESDSDEGGNTAVKEHPVISCRPLSKIVGFDK